MDKLQIITVRDSVAMSDDVSAPHELRFQLNTDAEIGDVFEELAKANYVPNVVGQIWGWELKIGGKIICHFGYEKNPTYLVAKDHPLKEYASAGVINVFLQYYSKWPEQLIRLFNCADYFSAEDSFTSGIYDENSHLQLILPFSITHIKKNLKGDHFVVGRPGTDGIEFCYRGGKKGLWAFYPISNEYKFMSNTIGELVDGWLDNSLSV